MKPEKRKRLVLFSGLTLVSFLSVVGTLAFFKQALLGVLRNILITDVIFIVLYIIWVKVHKGYEGMYKSGLEFEEER